MKSLFSEPMSINFEQPVRHSAAEQPIDKSQSYVEEKKVSLVEEDKDGLHHVYQEKEESKLNYALGIRRSKSFVQNDPIPQTFNMPKLPKSYEIQNRLQRKPYHKAILKLREINEREGPMMKVRLLEQVNRLLKEEIENFWQGIPIDESHLTITQDIKIPLYIYTILKSKIVNLPAHIKFIQEFTTDYVHENNLGSNLANYESAMTIVGDKERNILLNVIDQDEVLRDAVTYNESFATTLFNQDYDPFVEFTPTEVDDN